MGLAAAEMAEVNKERDRSVTTGVTTHIHVPTPGDHYSPATGSAIMTIIYEMARVHAAHGGWTCVIVSRGTRHDYPVGECIEVDPTNPPSKWQKAIDLGFSRVSLGRPFGASRYTPAMRGIPCNFHGSVFVHNNPVAIPRFKKLLPQARVFLWANNRLFDTYSDREIARVEATADGLICCSNYIADDLQSRLRKKSQKICIVHNGADIDQFRPVPLVSKSAVPIILFVGRVQAVKGCDLLVRAALRLRSAGIHFKLRIVGSSGFSSGDPLTPYELQLRRLAEPLGDQVEFQPFVDRSHVAEEFSKASIFCLPSNWDDPCPLTLAEAMASGLPTVASRRGGIPEMGADAIRYFSPPNIDELANVLSELLKDETGRINWRNRARARAEATCWRIQYHRLTEWLSR